MLIVTGDGAQLAFTSDSLAQVGDEVGARNLTNMFAGVTGARNDSVCLVQNGTKPALGKLLSLQQGFDAADRKLHGQVVDDSAVTHHRAVNGDAVHARQRVAKHRTDVEQRGVLEAWQARWHRQRRAKRVVRVSQGHAVRVEYGYAGGDRLNGLL